MRKVKVLALLLSALMVVAVFAGCADTDAIVTDVDNLESRVEVLEGLLNDQKDAIDNMNDQIGDVAEKLEDDTTADQLAAVLEALKQQQEANAAIQDQIKDLTDKVTKVEEDSKEEDETADDEVALQVAVKEYTANLQALKIRCELNYDLYIAEDYNAIVEAIKAGIVDISVAKTADEAKAAYDAAKAVYDAKAIVSEKLVALYAQVNNTITADSKALIDEIRAYIYDDTTKTPAVLCPVTVKYGTSAATSAKAELQVANINGDKNADGSLVKVNVVAELQKAVAAYDYLTGANNSKVFSDKVKAAVDAIKAIDVVTYGTTNLTAAKAAFEAVKADILGNATATTANTNVYAPYLADSAMALVTNSANIAAAEARLVELAIAAAMYETYGDASASGIASIFAGYKALSDKTLYTNKTVYDAVDAKLNKWIADYKLEDVNVKAILAVKEPTVNYDTYVADRLEMTLSVKAYTDFAAIANRIAALNGLTTVSAASMDEYKAIKEAINAWKVLRKADTTVTPAVTEILLSDANYAAIVAAYNITVGATTDANYFELYAFTNNDVKAFFQEKFTVISDQATAINTAIANLKSNIESGSTKYPTIQKYIELKGEYVKNGDVWEKVETPTGTSTIAGFLETYKAYDLSSLLKLADFEAALAKAIARIEGFKAGAATIKAKVDAISYVKVAKTNDASYDKATADNTYYYVNLADASAVAAANDAYTAWIKLGATSNLAEWIPAVDEDGEVIEDTYVFSPIADQTVINALKQMNEDILELQADAAKLVAHFELVAEVWNELSKTVDLFADNNTADVDVLTTVYAVLDAGKSGSTVMATPVVLANNESAYTINFNGTNYMLAKKAATVAATGAVGASVQEIINNGYTAYKAFLAKNAEITLKADGSIDKVKLAKDNAVEAALKKIAAAELVMVKDFAMNIVANAAVGTDAKLTATVADYYCKWIAEVDSLSDLTGNSLWTVAQELAAKYGVQIASYNRGDTISVCGKTDYTDYTQAFRAPQYDKVN